MSQNSKNWYFPNLQREEAERKLKEESRQNGTFLVRDSTSSNGDFVLSVLHQEEVTHFQIRRCTIDDAFFSIDQNTKILGLDSLIEHYQNSSTGIDGTFKLTEHCQGQPPPQDACLLGRENLLHRATTQGNYKVVTELIKSGKNLEFKNQRGQTAAHIASIQGKNDILLKLIESGASVNSRDTSGHTPLHYACQYNYPLTVRLLVQVGGANIQARNTENGWVALHEAASRGNKEVIQELLSLNAPCKPRTNNKLFPVDLARNNGHFDCVAILLNYRSPLPRTNRNRWFHGTMSRQEAERLIEEYDPGNGTFLVRFSERNKNTVLTLKGDTCYYNYIIQNEGAFYFIDDGPYLDSLEHVIEYYSFISDGLPTTLRNPVPPKPKPSVPDFSTIPRTKNKKLSTSISSQDLSTTSSEQHFNAISFKTNLTSINNNNNYMPEGERETEEEMGNDIEHENDYIMYEALQFINKIGQGEFGAVFEGVYIKNKEERLKVALKTLHSAENDTMIQESFEKEAQLMKKINHHCIVKFIGLSKGPTWVMVTELVPLGSMLNYILNNKERINPAYEFKVWAAQIACGMKYLEDQRFVHRDLAARNILLSSANQAKISDFGLSRALQADSDYYKNVRGGKWPLKWYAPESYNYGIFSHKSDVWSYGVTIWEMYSFGAQPYGDMPGHDAIKLIERNERLPQPEACPDYIYSIMLRCWQYEKNDRPTFQELQEIWAADNMYTNIRELIVERNLT